MSIVGFFLSTVHLSLLPIKWVDVILGFSIVEGRDNLFLYEETNLCTIRERILQILYLCRVSSYVVKRNYIVHNLFHGEINYDVFTNPL